MSMCMLRPSIFGGLSMTATSFRSSASRSRIDKPWSGCDISRPLNMMVILTLLPCVEEAQHVLLLGRVVAHVDLRAELHFLGLDLALVLARLLGLDRLIVLVLAVIHDAADGRIGVRGDLDQVETLVLGDAAGLHGGINAHLVSVVADQPAFAHGDLFVEPGLLSSYCAHLLSTCLLRLRASNKKPARQAGTNMRGRAARKLHIHETHRLLEAPNQVEVSLT